MKFIVYSEVSAQNISTSLGEADYSYYFVLKEFLPVLRGLGEVIVIAHPAEEVDAIFDASMDTNEPCVFLSFAPPHKTLLTLRCPTVPVFAWEFDSIPSEDWLGDKSQNWVRVLRHCGSAITHSQQIVSAVKNELSSDYSIVSLPAPVWDKFAGFRAGSVPGRATPSVRLKLRSGAVLDTGRSSPTTYLPSPAAVAQAVTAAREQRVAAQTAEPNSPYTMPANQSRLQITKRYLGEWYFTVACRLLPLLPNPRRAQQIPAPAAASSEQNLDGTSKIEGDASVPGVALLSARHMEPINKVDPQTQPKLALPMRMPTWELGAVDLQLDGIIFTSLFNPYDGRKNRMDMLTAFCAAFRDMPDATLVFKLGHTNCQSAMEDLVLCMARMPSFKCRVILLEGYLDDVDFESLIHATSFIVNASYGEGQCLPLMEFLSCGKPAVAPCHSGMRDYIDEEVAFVVNSWSDAAPWAHDPRLAFRTLRQQIDWGSLVNAYQSAYRCVKDDPDRYTVMSRKAIERMRTYCSRGVTTEKLQQFLMSQSRLSRKSYERHA